MKKIFDKVKLLFDTYKMWIFAAALFGTNATQAYLNGSAEQEFKFEEVTADKVITKSKEIIVTCKGAYDVISHEKEHHGRK